MSVDELSLNTSSGSDSSPSSNKVTFGNAVQNPNTFPFSFFCLSFVLLHFYLAYLYVIGGL